VVVVRMSSVGRSSSSSRGGKNECWRSMEQHGGMLSKSFVANTMTIIVTITITVTATTASATTTTTVIVVVIVAIIIIVGIISSH
jgi:cytochrome c biogenesis protein CcdA